MTRKMAQLKWNRRAQKARCGVRTLPVAAKLDAAIRESMRGSFMHKGIYAAVLLGSIAGTVPAAAGNVTADVDRIAAILQKEGYQAKRAGEGADPRIETAMGGYSASIYFYGCDDKGQACKSVQFYAGFNPKTSPTLQGMNDYSKDNRFGRVYLDKDNDPVIEMDIDLEAGGMSEELFLDNLAYWNSILGAFADFVFAD